MHAPLVVLGGGPGGYAAAFYAADAGVEVTLVEAEPRLGGTCLLRGCIPSKSLLHVARVLAEVGELRRDWGIEFGSPQIDLAKIRARKEKVVETLSNGLRQLAKRRNVRVIQARGQFLNSNTLALEGLHESIPPERQLTFDHAIIATGSTPSLPALFSSVSPRVMDSTGALDLTDIPGSLLVIGGGYIGLEMGSVYASLGSKVSIVEMTETLLPGADRDLVNPLQRQLKKVCEDRIYLGTQVSALRAVDNGVEATFAGANKSGVERFDRVLVAVGRRPNSSGVGLETTQVQLDGRGFVQVDAQQRTADARLLAIGDVAGEPMLAHKASHQAKVAVQTVLGRAAAFAPAAIPAVVFTDPELAWAGLTQDQANRSGQVVEAALYPWLASGRAQALGRTEGLTKWLIDPATRRVLGCGIVGPGAGELIGEAVVAIERGSLIDEIAHAIHPHPTLSETLMNAGEVFFGTAVEIYKPRRAT